MLNPGGRRINSFFLFNSENRQKICDENRGLDKVEVSRLLGRLWQTLDPNKKLEFKQKAEEMRRMNVSKRSDNQWTDRQSRRVREREHKVRSVDQRIGHRTRKVFQFVAIPIPQIANSSDPIPESLESDPIVESNTDTIVDEKDSFMAYLGLCRPDSAQYQKAVQRHRKSAMKYQMFVYREVQTDNEVKQRPKTRTKAVTNQVKRPRGRPRKCVHNGVITTGV